MAQSKGNKAKGRQSSHNKGYYEHQKFVTITNKLRKASARKRRRNQWLANVAARAARGEPVPARFTIK